MNQQKWEYHETITENSANNSSRILLYPDAVRPPFALEFIRTRSTTRLYLNILRMEAMPHPEYCKRTTIEVVINDETMKVHPYLLKGGQRLLFCDEFREMMTEALLSESSIKIKLGSREYPILTSGFKDCYSSFQQIPLESLENTQVQ